MSDYLDQTPMKPQGPSPAEGLSPAERIKLGAIMSRLASPYAGERAAAGLLASAFVTKHNLSWSDLTTLLHPAPKTPASSDRAQADRPRASARERLGYGKKRATPPGQALNLYT